MHIKFKNSEISLKGHFPQVNDQFPELKLVNTDLTEVSSNDFKGKKLVFNIFPSVDTAVCAMQLKQFSNSLKDREDVTLVFTSLDLPFAFQRFCGAEGIDNAITASDFRYRAIEKLGVLMEEGPLKNLYARAVIVCDENLKITYAELVDEVTNEPDYDAAMKHL
ncbi:MAG: thiol peroxidase [Psychroflexus sp.]|nr:thiol peroxidase [Psychroflexus sp.]MDN6309249.1 thiol peroxidase [Psychroflexus sp.]